MPLFIMLKKCTNTCTLQYAGDDLDKATERAFRLSKQLRVTSYVLNNKQVANMFADQKDKLHEWWEVCCRGEITLFLPLNFKKFLR